MSRKEIPKEIGIWFEDYEDLKLASKDLLKPNNPEYYFDSKWKKNYNIFMREEVRFNHFT